MVNVFLLIGLMVFFVILLFIFTIIPRITLVFIGRLLEFKEWNTARSLLKNSLEMFALYFSLGLPFSFIVYQALGNHNQQLPLLIFIIIFLSLVAARLSILLEKRKYLQKVGLQAIAKLSPEKLKKSALRSEYRSYLFGVFVSGFILGILLLIVKTITIPAGILFTIPSIRFVPTILLESTGKYTINGIILFLVSLAAEILLQKAGYYKINIKKEEI